MSRQLCWQAYRRGRSKVSSRVLFNNDAPDVLLAGIEKRSVGRDFFRSYEIVDGSDLAIPRRTPPCSTKRRAALFDTASPAAASRSTALIPASEIGRGHRVAWERDRRRRHQKPRGRRFGPFRPLFAMNDSGRLEGQRCFAVRNSALPAPQAMISSMGTKVSSLRKRPTSRSSTLTKYW
jgi:hypothetical protein